MITCLICLTSLEFSNESALCIPNCGHVFHQPCVLRNVIKTCPKCRCEVRNTSQLIRLYFGTSTNSEELNSEIKTLLEENEMYYKKTEFMLQEMNKNMRIIAQNSGEIAEKRSMLIEKKEAENRTFQLKNVAVLLSRADEMRRIQDYYNSLSN